MVHAVGPGRLGFTSCDASAGASGAVRSRGGSRGGRCCRVWRCRSSGCYFRSESIFRALPSASRQWPSERWKAANGLSRRPSPRTRSLPSHPRPSRLPGFHDRDWIHRFRSIRIKVGLCVPPPETKISSTRISGSTKFRTPSAMLSAVRAVAVAIRSSLLNSVSSSLRDESAPYCSRPAVFGGFARKYLSRSSLASSFGSISPEAAIAPSRSKVCRPSVIRVTN